MDEQIEDVLAVFADSAEVSSWTRSAVVANLDADIVRGSGLHLAPKSNLTRAEAAAMIMRLLAAVDII